MVIINLAYTTAHGYCCANFTPLYTSEGISCVNWAGVLGAYAKKSFVFATETVKNNYFVFPTVKIRAALASVSTA